MPDLKSAAARWRNKSVGDLSRERDMLADWAAKVIESLPDGAELPSGDLIVDFAGQGMEVRAKHYRLTEGEKRAVAALLILARALVSEVS